MRVVESCGPGTAGTRGKWDLQVAEPKHRRQWASRELNKVQTNHSQQRTPAARKDWVPPQLQKALPTNRGGSWGGLSHSPGGFSDSQNGNCGWRRALMPVKSTSAAMTPSDANAFMSPPPRALPDSV